jgi:hypothetical protein
MATGIIEARPMSDMLEEDQPFSDALFVAIESLLDRRGDEAAAAAGMRLLIFWAAGLAHYPFAGPSMSEETFLRVALSMYRLASMAGRGEPEGRAVLQ